MTKEDILNNFMCKRAFDLARNLLLKRNNRVSETTLLDVADVLLNLYTQLEIKDREIAELKTTIDSAFIRDLKINSVTGLPTLKAKG